MIFMMSLEMFERYNQTNIGLKLKTANEALYFLNQSYNQTNIGLKLENNQLAL